MPTLISRAIAAVKRSILPTPLTAEQKAELALRREWDKQLANAMSDRDRAEIDAIFSRAEITINR